MVGFLTTTSLCSLCHTHVECFLFFHSQSPLKGVETCLRKKGRDLRKTPFRLFTSDLLSFHCSISMHSCSSSPTEDWEITTSLRYDPSLRTLPNDVLHTSNGAVCSPLYMLPMHRDRLSAAAKGFNWPEAVQDQILNLGQQITAYLKSIDAQAGLVDCLKIRVTLSSQGIFNVTSTKVLPVPLTCLFPRSLTDLIWNIDSSYKPTFRILLATSSLAPSLFTRHKTTNRTVYDDVRSKTLTTVENPGAHSSPLFIEVLCINDSNEIMEGTITTPYFYRGDQWITPAADCGGNLGTTRQYALDEGLCKEGIIKKEAVHVGERIVLSNGVRGFGWGVIER